MSTPEILKPLRRLLEAYSAERDQLYNSVSIAAGPEKGAVPDLEDRLALAEMGSIRDAAADCLAVLSKAAASRLPRRGGVS